MSLVLKKIFAFKCNLPMLRLTTMLTLLTLPIPLTRLLCFHQRTRPPPSVMTPTPDGVVLAAFPIAWFFGFLYYTDVPSLWFVLSTIATATEGRHWLAALVRLTSLWRTPRCPDASDGLMNLRAHASWDS
jgi:alpha-1,2-glucosyltransferase